MENEAPPTPMNVIYTHHNTQAVSAILSSLNPKECLRVSRLESAQKIWEKLVGAHEGVDVVQKSRLQVLKNQFNFFVMKKGEEPQQTHDMLMDIVNERRSYGDKVTDEEVNYKLLMSFRVWNSTLCTIIEEKEGFEKSFMDKVIGRILAHNNRDDEDKRVSVLIGNESTIKKDVALKVKKKEDDNIDDVEVEEDNEESVLFVKKFGKFMFQNGFTKKNFDKAKARRTKRKCYHCNDPGHLIADCPHSMAKKRSRRSSSTRTRPSRSHSRAKLTLANNMSPMMIKKKMMREALPTLPMASHRPSHHSSTTSPMMRMMLRSASWLRKITYNLNLVSIILMMMMRWTWSPLCKK